jgi:hypothetical protein
MVVVAIIDENAEQQDAQGEREDAHDGEIAFFAAPDVGDRRQPEAAPLLKSALAPMLEEHARKAGDRHGDRGESDRIFRGLRKQISREQHIGQDIDRVSDGAVEKGFDQRPIDRKRQREVRLVAARKTEECEHGNPDRNSDLARRVRTMRASDMKRKETGKLPARGRPSWSRDAKHHDFPPDK